VTAGWWRNFVFDPVLYVRTAFEDLPQEAFVREEIDGLLVSRLRDVESLGRVCRERGAVE